LQKAFPKHASSTTSVNSKNKPIALTTQQIEDFYSIGFIVLRNLFSPTEVQDISDSFDRLQSLAQQLRTTQVYRGSQFVVEGSRIDRIVWMGGAEPQLLKIGEDSRLLLPISQLLNVDSMEHLICQGHYKLPGDQVKFDWHQDCQHRGLGTEDWVDVDGRGSYVQTLMAIDEVTSENGPVSFVPYSVQRGYLGLDQQNPEKFTEIFNLNSAVPLHMQVGDVAFFSPYAIHGSKPNNSSGSRRVFINGFASPGANRRVYPGEGAGRTVRLQGL
jgi:ectoine hydroxylase-related dioxygenase (phytanoyl-CoA dioxygenase family)